MHRRENNDKRARSEPEIGGCRYTRLREEVEASLKPAMFHHSVRTPSLLRGVYHGEPQHTVLFISISVEKKTSTDAGLQKCGDGHFHRLILNLRRTNNLAPTSLDIYSLSEHSGVIFTLFCQYYDIIPLAASVEYSPVTEYHITTSLSHRLPPPPPLIPIA